MGIRTFIAIEIPEDVRSAIFDAFAPMRKLLPDSVKWVKPENMHLTLKFLGDTPEELVADIESAIMKATDGTPPITAESGGAGAFPGTRRPSVLWAGIECPPALLGLKKRMEEAMVPLGFEQDEREFRPHLTVGRVRRGARVPGRRLAAELELVQARSFGFMEIREVVLMKSDLRPGGPVYKRLYSSVLNA